MQPRIDTNLSIKGEPDAWVHSACVLCANGCGLDIAVKDGRIVGVRGPPITRSISATLVRRANTVGLPTTRKPLETGEGLNVYTGH